MKAAAGFIVLCFVLGLAQIGNAATTYTVGGDTYGWNAPPTNSTDFYDQWATNHTFLAGDSFAFKWNGTHTATQVGSKEEYENCTKTGIILVDSGVEVTFKENGTFYFVCSVDNHCEEGQKVTIKVGNGISPSNAAPSLLSLPSLPFSPLQS